MLATIHQPRIAWEAARSLIEDARADDAVIFGPVAASVLEATRRRLTDPTAGSNEVHAQRGLWRVRLEDELRNNPGLFADLADLVAEVAARR